MNEHRNTAGFPGSIKHLLEVSDQELRTRPENMLGVCVCSSPGGHPHSRQSWIYSKQKQKEDERVLCEAVVLTDLRI